MENVLDSDDVSDTLNYAELCELIRQEMAQPSCLLEHVAGRIARTVFSRFPRVLSLHISVTKENPPMGANCAGAGVEFTFNK
jgi:dihydroneopterin aldolase